MLDSGTRTTDNGGLHDLILRGRGTQVAQAVAARPSVITLWIGNNDVLGAAVRGRAVDGETLTPAAAFRGYYAGVVATLRNTGARIFAANLPDVTSIPFVTTIAPVVVNPTTGQPVLANGQPIPLIGPAGPLPTGSLVTLGASSLLAQGIGIPAAVGGRGTPLPDEVVIDPTELAIIKDRVTVNNQAIAEICAAANIPVLDVNGIMRELAQTGRTIGGRDLHQLLPHGRNLQLRRRAPDGPGLRDHRQRVDPPAERERRRPPRGRPAAVRRAGHERQRRRAPQGAARGLGVPAGDAGRALRGLPAPGPEVARVAGEAVAAPAGTRSTAELVTAVRGIVSEELVPLESEFLARPFRELLPVLAERRARIRARGLWAPHLPPEWGGLGLALPAFARLSEEMGRTPLGHYAFGCQAPDMGNMELLLRHGTPAQQERFLRPLASGATRSCFAMTEPGRAGSNPVWLETTARRDGDRYVLDGRKWFTSGADGAAFAIVMAVTDPEAPPHRRASQILVPTDTPGWTRVRNIPVMGQAGEDYFSHSEVTLEGVSVPVENRIGPEGSGFALAQERLGPGRIHHAMRWIGVAERALDLQCTRLATRLLRPGQALASRQALQHDLADSRAEIDASRLLVMDTAERMETEGGAARVRVSLIKYYVANMLDRVLDRAVQAHGALGLTDDTVLGYMWRHERAARIYDGPDEVHKSVVAREVLKPYGVDVEV